MLFDRTVLSNSIMVLLASNAQATAKKQSEIKEPNDKGGANAAARQCAAIGIGLWQLPALEVAALAAPSCRAPARSCSPMPMPLALTDDEFAAVQAAAAPIHPLQRDAFLKDLAVELQNTKAAAAIIALSSVLAFSHWPALLPQRKLDGVAGI
jgi:hypothetical protein